MPRRPTPKKDECTHITVRCNNRLFLLNLEENWEDISSWILCLPYYFDVALHHVVLMSNHMHLLITPTKDNLGKAMCYFLTNLSKCLNYKAQRRDHFWGGRYYPSIIRSEKYFMNVIRYMYQNPVRSGMVSDIAHYSYSSFGFYKGHSNPRMPITPDRYTQELFRLGLSGRDIWLDQVYTALGEKDIGHMKKSLARYGFKFSRDQQKILASFPTTLVT